jgi:hypothetical protein
MILWNCFDNYLRGLFKAVLPKTSVQTQSHLAEQFAHATRGYSPQQIHLEESVLGVGEP